MLGFQKTFRFLNAALRNQMFPKASMGSNPPKEIITPAEQAIAMSVMFMTFLIPSSWILCHLENYKHRPSE
uniref:Uncharacterized protein n=1 Tax=Sphaerodactylus townsendi TaxID=933632 RepID=A0ACB8G219_9SAUR